MLDFRNIYRENILLRILLCVVPGILIAEQIIKFSILQEVFICLVLLCIISFIYFLLFYLNKSHATYHKSNAIILKLCIISIIVILHIQNQEIFHLNYLKEINQPNLNLLIDEEPIYKNKKYTCNASIIKDNNELGRVKIVFDSSCREIKYGKLLSVKNKLEIIPNSRHPKDFNYKEYLRYKHVYHQLKIDTFDIINIEDGSINQIFQLANTCRNNIINSLKSNIHDTLSFEMSAALLLGYRADLDKDLMKTFSETGTIHIISVSGLHVGIIFLVIQLLIRKSKLIKNRFVEASILIISIWFYSILTGLPASVCRCALMISLGIISNLIYRRTNPFNIISASALILLIYDTNLLFDVGFQLSFLAITGIILLQKRIEHIFYIPNIYIHQLWAMSSVSIAAQITTLPLCLYYYHQFPNYFILANLFAIPLSSVALYASVASVSLSWIPYVDLVIEWILIQSIKLMNFILFYIRELPYAISKNLFVDQIDTIFICIYICLFILLFKYRIRLFFKYIFLCIAFHFTYCILESYTKSIDLYIVPQKNSAYVSILSNKELTHYIPIESNIKNIRHYLNKWDNHDVYIHKIVYYNSNESVILNYKNEIFNIGKNTSKDLKVKDIYVYKNKVYRDNKPINLYNVGYLKY